MKFPFSENYKNGLKKLIVPAIILTLVSSCNQSNTIESNTQSAFKVWGNCDMCKETIEGSLKVDGIAKADWNPETDMINVSYDSTKISLDQIQKNIAEVGYDNEKYNGDNTAYSKLPECCKYERK